MKKINQDFFFNIQYIRTDYTKSVLVLIKSGWLASLSAVHKNLSRVDKMALYAIIMITAYYYNYCLKIV